MEGDGEELAAHAGGGPVHPFEEVGGEVGALDHARLRLAFAALGADEEAAEDDPRAGVGAAQVGVGLDDELAVLGRARPRGEVFEVRLVPDLPDPDRPRGQQRVFAPEAAAGAVAEDREAEEFAPAGALGRGLHRQADRRFGAVADPFVADRPARRRGEEGEDGEPRFGGGADGRVDRAPVGRRVLARLHRRPVDRRAQAFDPARLQRLPLGRGRRFVGDDPPEALRQRRRGAAGGDSATSARDRTRMRGIVRFTVPLTTGHPRQGFARGASTQRFDGADREGLGGCLGAGFEGDRGDLGAGAAGEGDPQAGRHRRRALGSWGS